MPYYRLKSGKLINVPENLLEDFKSSEQFEGAVLIEEEVKPVKTEAVATEDASVTAMDSASENGSSEPLSNEQASFNYEQRTGNKPGSIMDLTDDDYIEKGPMGETLLRKNSSGVVITDYEEIKKTLKKTPEAKQKLIKLATKYAEDGLEGDVFDTWEDARQYIDDQSDKFDEEAKAEKEQIYKFDDNFKLKDKAIEQLRKDTGNTSNTFDTPFSEGLFKQGLQAISGNWINDAKTDVPSQVIELEDSLEGAIAGGEDVRTLQKLAQGKMNLQDKEALINKYRIPKILEVRKELVKEYDALKLETEDVFGDLKRQESSLVRSMNLIKNNKPATGYTQETVDKYNGLLKQYNSLKDTFKQTSDRYKGKQESLNKSQEVINAQWGVDIARMALKSNFKLTDDVKKYTEAFSGDGVFNWAVDQVGGTAQEMVKLAGQTVVGFPVFVTTAFGDLFTDDDTYSSFDSMRDTWGDLLNFNVVPDSKDEKFNITDGEGNLKEFSARAWSKTAFNMIPFTAEIIRNVKQGKFTGYREGLGKMLSNYTKAGAVTKSAQNMKNLIISSDAAFRMTILNNSIEANKKGLSGPAGDLYATTVSFTEGLVQAIMPDYKFIKGGAGKEIKNALFNSLKGLTTKEGTKAAVKTYTGNMFKELLEEEVTFGMNIITDMAFGLGALKQNEFVDEQINLIAGTFMLSGGMGLAGVKNTYNAQKAQIYKDIFNNLKSTDLYFKTMLETATDPSLIEDINKARVFVRDVASVMNTAPEDVSSDQIELLIQKKKLIEKKKNTDSSFHGPINDRIKEIDSEIENSSIKRSITERFDKDVSNFAKSLNSIGQKIDETKIFEDDQDGSADDKMEEFLISVGQSKEYAKETKDSYGTFVVDADGKEILVINKASALSNRVVTTGQHEFLHKLLKASMSSKPELVQQAGELLLKEILASSSSSSSIVARIESYATDNKITVEKFFEEILPLFSEAVTNKEVKLNESSITKIQDFFRRIFQDLGLRNIRFDKAEGVINFIKDYNKAYSKGNFKGSLKALAGKDGDGKVSGVSLSKSVSELNTELEDLIDREFEMDEGDFDAQKSNLELKIRQAKKPSVKKESSTKEKSAPKKVYDNEGLIETIKSKDTSIKEKAKAEADLVESFDNMALRAIKYDTRKGDYDRDEVKDYLREFLPRIIESYKPGDSKFSTWVYNNIAPKAQQTYEKFRKIADKSLDVEAGGVGSVKEMSGDVNTLYGSDSKPSDLKDSTQKMIKATSFGPISDPSILEAVESVIDIKEDERPNFKSLNNKFFDKVSEAIFGISGKKARGNATLKYDKSGGSSEANSLQNVFKNDSDVRKFIKTMPDYNIATKETVVNEQGETIDVSRDTYGRSIGINPKVLAIFYDKVDGAIPGISSPNGRSLGKTTQTDVYKLKSEFTGNISPSSVAKLQSLIGINKGTLSIPIKGEARTEFGSILTGLTKMYIDNVINTVGRSKLDSNQAKADLGAGKSSLMFSKNIEGVVREQEIINNLGLQPGSNHNSLLEIQFSKKKRAEYESILMKNRPDLANIPKQVESLFDWADKLNVPENKKPKYKKLALYYTVNGYTRFPEDGYKIEEVVRLSNKNKIDPYAYANPDELINKFTEEIKASKVNPDNMPALSNKQEFGDSVTVYDVEDSRKGQRAVRSIVDSNWGENANPWCLIARTKQKLIASFKTESEAKVFAENNKNKLDDLYVKFEPNARRWTVMKPVDPKNIMNIAWTHWQQYNRNATGYGYKIAFQKGKLLSLRDGGAGDPGAVEIDDNGDDTSDEVQWWDRFDKPSDNLTVDLGKDKDTGYKIIGSIDYEGNFDITGYGEGDFMSRTSDFKLYDADKSLIEQKDFKDGKISFWLKNEPTKMNNGGRAVTKIESKYTDGVFDSSISTVKDLRTGNIVTKRTISHTTLSEDSYIKEEIVVGKNGRSPTAPKVTTKTIKIINSSGQTTRNIDIFYDERITDGVSVVNTDRMAELESIKKPFISLSKSVNKAAKSNNNMLPESQRLTGDFTNQDVLDRMGELDDEINEAELKFSKNAAPKLDKEFNDIIENKTGIASSETIAGVKAGLMGKKKGRFNFFIPPSAEDFMGLLYATLGEGSVGNSQMKWYKDNLIDPYARGVENITRDRNNLGRDFRALKRDLKIVPKNLKKKVKGSLFTREQAVRVYIWEQIGEKTPDLSEADIAELVELVESDPKLKLFAQEIMKLNKGRAYVKPSDKWVTGTITTDLLEALNTTGRKEYLELWQQNVDIIFSPKNLNKLEAAFGESYKEAMKDILKRMKSGRNRGFGNKQVERFTDWINGSTAAIMFFNTRSATLQLISAVNFINFGDNNIIAAGKAFANQLQFWSDFKTLWNSDFLVERRDGLKINVNEQDIADVAKESGVRGVINKLLKLGFTPTQLADSFAIASGGSTFYRNRLNSLVKGGMNPIAANKQAMRDFREIAEESQQSSRPDKISQEQAGPLGRIVLAFANTPAQYARIIKKSASDLKNGRGDAKTNLSRILYYGVVQNLIFNYMQQALFALMFEDDEEDKSILDEKVPKAINGMVDGLSRGTGVYGAIFTVVKNTSIKLYEESQKKNSNYKDKILEVVRISPPIASKLQKMQSAGRAFDWNIDEIKSKGFSLDNPVFLAGGNVVSASTNIPLDRVVKKLNNLKAASDAEVATYKRIALLMGWNEWELGLTEKKSKTKSKSKAKKTGIKRPTVNPQGKISGY